MTLSMSKKKKGRAKFKLLCQQTAYHPSVPNLTFSINIYMTYLYVSEHEDCTANTNIVVSKVCHLILYI